jgi:hypothetical protein
MIPSVLTCEHYVNDVWSEKLLSKQINTAAVLIA